MGDEDVGHGRRDRYRALKHSEYTTVEFAEMWPPGEEILFDFSKIEWEGCDVRSNGDV